jgi:hypothetical protein
LFCSLIGYSLNKIIIRIKANIRLSFIALKQENELLLIIYKLRHLNAQVLIDFIANIAKEIYNFKY